MCKHVLNAQVSIRSPCCRKWFDCPDCHTESETHPLLKVAELTLVCKKCKKAFRKDSREFEEADEYCPHCDNHYVLAAKVPKPMLKVESEDVRMDNRFIKDDRLKDFDESELFDVVETADRLG
ncbi:hypothetical protein Dda_8512 [Drechslerella dactyloides]|uniref:CHY-type domain-containing protein n=1 Tax=Drechslerella dactyloides TaxID=74499 RepID=A0AAD6IUF6_DREDA|nr:hypothetical protein Dda_8512 [Drechslerella dactyloides]